MLSRFASNRQRVLNLADGVAKIPDKGIAALNREENRAILATFGDPESQATSSNTGLPQPIQVERKAGDTDIKTLTAQVYLLSQSHVGAMNSTARLPITTYYADRASEAAAEGYLPKLRNSARTSASSDEARSSFPEMDNRCSVVMMI